MEFEPLCYPFNLSMPSDEKTEADTQPDVEGGAGEADSA